MARGFKEGVAIGLLQNLKAALINIVILTLDQMTTCNVRGVIRSSIPTESSVPLSFTAHFSIF